MQGRFNDERETYFNGTSGVKRKECGSSPLPYTPAVEPTVTWRDGRVVLIDQRKLPLHEEYLTLGDHRAVAAAIRDMAVRGAPAIGVTAAYGLALAVDESRAEGAALAAEFEAAAGLLASTRPTAVNLFWAIERMRARFRAGALLDRAAQAAALLAEAKAIDAEDVAACRAMGDLGAALLPPGARVLTHCNAGALATAGYGTALGVIRSAHRDGRVSRVFVDETRPFLQGARLTAWELHHEGIPATLIADNMAGHLMARGEIDAVVVGSDRIARNGDVANKIGTYSVAVLAKEHGLPFYVAAPVSTFDLACPSGAEIPIEERSPDEVTHHGGRRVAPEGIAVRNPAFDVTPARYVSAIVCERGVARAPFEASLAALAGA